MKSSRLLHRRREPPDAHVGVEKQGCNFGAVEQVVEIVGARLQLPHLDLELAVDGVQLLVERLQLLLRGLQLLVRGLQLLVDRLDLFVRGLQLLVGGLHLLGKEPQLLAGRMQLGLQLTLREPLRGRGRRLPSWCRLTLQEAHRQHAVGGGRPERPDHEPDGMQRPAAPDAGVDRAFLVVMDRLLHRRAQRRLQALAREGKQVGRSARRRAAGGSRRSDRGTRTR